MTFAQLNLDSQISKAISICGYTTPTPIQARCIPDILNGKDLVASAQTGTGKTAAFVLPALQRLSIKRATQHPRILILTPTRELASQITQAAGKYGKFLRFNMASLVGGMPYRQQLRDLSRAVDIIVATPGRLLDHVESGRLDLSGIEMLILDEADRMLDMGFIDDVQAIASMTPSNRQTLLFSATVDEKLSHIVRHLLNKPIRIDLSEEKMAPALIKQEIYMADNIQHKNRLLEHFLKNESIFKGIIFSATKINADKLAKELRDMDLRALPLHGDLKQSVRNKTVEQLRKGRIQFVVATDVAARGIDISDVTHVINYDLPRFCEDYVHRIGRTGRAGKTGVAISFVMPIDARHLQRIEKFTGQKLQKLVIPGLEPTKQAASAAPSKKKKSFGKSYGKSFSGPRDRDGYSKGGSKGFSGRKERDGSSEGRSFSGRRDRDGAAKTEGKSFGGRRDRDGSSEGRSFSGRRDRDGAAKTEGKSFGGRRDRDGSSEGRSFSGRRDRDGAAKTEGKSFGGRRERDGASEGRSFSGRRDRDGAAKTEGKSFGGRRDRDGSAAKSGGKKFSGSKEGSSRSGGKSFSGAKKPFKSGGVGKSFSAKPKRKD